MKLHHGCPVAGFYCPFFHWPFTVDVLGDGSLPFWIRRCLTTIFLLFISKTLFIFIVQMAVFLGVSAFCSRLYNWKKRRKKCLSSTRWPQHNFFNWRAGLGIVNSTFVVAWALSFLKKRKGSTFRVDLRKWSKRSGERQLGFLKRSTRKSLFFLPSFISVTEPCFKLLFFTLKKSGPIEGWPIVP